MSDTPETDALRERFLTDGEWPDLFAHARRLERERNDLLKQNARLRDIAEWFAKHFVDECYELETAQQLRAELDQLKDAAKCSVCTHEQKCWECADDTSLKEGAK